MRAYPMTQLLAVEGDCLVYLDGPERREIDLADCARRMAAMYPAQCADGRCVGTRTEDFLTLDLCSAEQWQERVCFYAPVERRWLRLLLLRLRGVDAEAETRAQASRVEAMLAAAGWQACLPETLLPEQPVPYGELPATQIPFDRILSIGGDSLLWQDEQGLQHRIDLADCAERFRREHPGSGGRCVGERWLATHFVLYTKERAALVNPERKRGAAFEGFRKVQKMLSDAGWTTFDAT